ncbi:MAG: Uma2 family endonuclease [Trichodesmium sp.]
MGVYDTTLEKDLEKKRFIYTRAGILEYWIVNLEAKQLIVLQQPSTDNY